MLISSVCLSSINFANRIKALYLVHKKDRYPDGGYGK